MPATTTLNQWGLAAFAAIVAPLVVEIFKRRKAQADSAAKVQHGWDIEQLRHEINLPEMIGQQLQAAWSEIERLQGRCRELEQKMDAQAQKLLQALEAQIAAEGDLKLALQELQSLKAAIGAQHG